MALFCRMHGKLSQPAVLLRVVQIRAALLTWMGSESEIESNMGDVSFGVGSTQKVKTRGEDLSLS
jgi:hypothetical protein